LRLPIPGFDLKSVAAYFGIPRISTISDGLRAQTAYLNYQVATDESTKRRLREMLLDYSRDDLDALIGAAQGIRALATREDK
jgi:predicted RecB family nuclease